jgi:hypothetical protein
VIPEPYMHRPLQAAHRPATRELVIDYLPRTRFAVVDANVLLKNISRDARQWPDTSLMLSLAQRGWYRVFAAEHVYGEVEDHLDCVIADSGRDVALARKIWTEQYLPRVRFVSIDPVGLSRFDARIAAVQHRDPDDAPTAALAILLGTRGLSEDLDLLDPGLATGRPWLQLVAASKDVTFGETANFGVVLTTTLSANSFGTLGQHLKPLTTTTPGRVSMLLGLLVICAIAVFLPLRANLGRATSGSTPCARARLGPRC